MLDYEIKDVNSRRAGPLLQLMVRMSPEGGEALRDISEDQLVTTIPANQVAEGKGAVYRGRMNLTLVNRGRGTATVARYEVGLPQPWGSGISWGSRSRDDRIRESVGPSVSVFMTSPAFSQLSTARQFRLRGIRVDTQVVEWRAVVYRAEDTQPLWPSETLEGDAERVSVTMPSSTEEIYWIPWRVFAEGMVEMRGIVLVEQTPDHIRARNFLLGETDWAGSLEDERHAQLRDQYGV